MLAHDATAANAVQALVTWLEGLYEKETA